jgi:beta-mannosidase
MAKINYNEICLDGKDWFANWFVSDEEYQKNKAPRHIRNMEIDSGESAEVFSLNFSNADWLKGTIPGCARTFLIENGKLDDPYFDRNCEQSRWVEDYCWWFRKEFKVPGAWKNKKCYIKFLGLDYACDIYVNGGKISNHVGMFVQPEFDISDIIYPGQNNVITLGFSPAPKAEPHHSPTNDITDFARHHRCQMSWGWDWSRHLVPTGIWDSIYIKSYDKIRILDMYCNWENANLNIELEIENIESDNYNFYFDVSPENFNGKSYNNNFTEYLTSGKQKLSFKIKVDQPELWHPNGNGKQNLYKISVQVDNELKEQLFGFRIIEASKNINSPENAYPLTFNVNEKKIFIRGANWVPADLMPSRLSREDYERQVRLAAEAGMNMLRVWGGGLVEKDAFYECCDRYGILVWQEFPLCCSKYPQDKEYLSFKKHEGIDILKRLRNHACIALWCGGNEMQYYGELPDSPLLKQYEDIVKENIPGSIYHVSSPDLSRPGERDHGPWDLRSHKDYNEHFRIFASEIGCNGMTELESIKHFIPHGESWPEGSAFKYHFLVTHGHKSITKPLGKFSLNSLEEFCQASQFAQADTLGYIMEHYRCLWPESSGCLIWQYNESWPTLAWSFIDWYTRPKMAYYRLKKACSPVMLRLKDKSWTIDEDIFKAELWGVNDSHYDLETVKINFTLMNSKGKIFVNDSFEVNMPANKALKICEYNKKLNAPKDGDILFGFIRISKGSKTIFATERIYGLNGFRNFFKLPQSSVEVRQIDYKQQDNEHHIILEIRNNSDFAAGGINLRLNDIPIYKTYWSDNYFSLIPGEIRNIELKVACEDKPSQIDVKAWNIPKNIFILDKEEAVTLYE